MGESRTLNRATRCSNLKLSYTSEVESIWTLPDPFSLFLYRSSILKKLHILLTKSWNKISTRKYLDETVQSHFSFVYFRVPSSTVIGDTLIFRTLNTQRENAQIQRKMLVACMCACVKSSNQLGRLFITNLWMRGMISVVARNTDTVPFFFNF